MDHVVKHDAIIYIAPGSLDSGCSDPLRLLIQTDRPKTLKGKDINLCQKSIYHGEFLKSVLYLFLLFCKFCLKFNPLVVVKMALFWSSILQNKTGIWNTLLITSTHVYMFIPKYFIDKIICIIKQSDQYPNYNYQPPFWLGSDWLQRVFKTPFGP